MFEQEAVCYLHPMPMPDEGGRHVIQYALVQTCRECGYDLRGNNADRCPECGLQFTMHKYKMVIPPRPAYARYSRNPVPERMAPEAAREPDLVTPEPAALTLPAVVRAAANRTPRPSASTKVAIFLKKRNAPKPKT